MSQPDWESEWLRPSGLATKPFLKWAGGKGALLPQLRQFVPFPLEGQTYYEPFLGAGAVFFALAPPRAVLSDINRSLVETFCMVKTHPAELIDQLGRLPSNPSRDDYYELRELFNRLRSTAISGSLEERERLASLFIWLNRTCFNGLYRVNSAGDFNVPFGDPVKPILIDASRVRAASRALRRSKAELVVGDYEVVLRGAVSGDIVYLDPPYEPLSETSAFTGYTDTGFGRDEQVRLSEVVKSLVSRGCRIVLSNSSSEFVRELYREFRTHVVVAPRAINSNGTRRGKVKEIVVVH